MLIHKKKKKNSLCPIQVPDKFCSVVTLSTIMDIEQHSLLASPNTFGEAFVFAIILWSNLDLIVAT